MVWGKSRYLRVPVDPPPRYDWVRIRGGCQGVGVVLHPTIEAEGEETYEETKTRGDTGKHMRRQNTRRHKETRGDKCGDKTPKFVS